MNENMNILPDGNIEVGQPEDLKIEHGPETRKRIALVAHDNKKSDLLEWACYNRELLIQHDMYATGTTGKILEQELGFEITTLQS